MITILFWSCLLLIALAGILALCCKEYTLYIWSGTKVRPDREYFSNRKDALKRAQELRIYGYTVMMGEN